MPALFERYRTAAHPNDDGVTKVGAPPPHESAPLLPSPHHHGHRHGQAADQVQLSETTVEVDGLGTIPLPFGCDPTAEVTQFLHQARKAGHRIDAAKATEIMESVCGMCTCVRPLDVADRVLQISPDWKEDLGMLVVSFGEEPARAIERWVGDVVKAGGSGMVDASSAQKILEIVCKSVPCYSSLNTEPTSLNVTIGADPAVSVTRFLEVPYGHDPAVSVTRFLDQVMDAGHTLNAGEQKTEVVGSGRVGAQRPRTLFRTSHVHTTCCSRPGSRRACACFPPLLTSNTTLLPPPPSLSPPLFFPRSASSLVPPPSDIADQIYERICAFTPCYGPIDVSPYTLQVDGMGTITVPFGLEPVASVESFIAQARGAGHQGTLGWCA